MHIVVTNDDGIQAPGIHALAKAARTLGNVTVIAPNCNWSASGHKKTFGKPLRLDPYPFEEADAAWVSDGSPADCATFATLGALDEPVDLLLSGVNPSPNLGEDVSYSGTVNAALEGALWDIPSAAVSIDYPRVKPEEIDFTPVEVWLPKILREMLAHPLPSRQILNINFPGVPLDEIRGCQVTRTGHRIYRDILIPRTDPFGRPYYWVGGEPPVCAEEPGTDGFALQNGYISLTPITMDTTAEAQLKAVEAWNL